MANGAHPTFELHGEFRGFFRDVFGKRRMAMRVEGEEVYLKVPKALRELVGERFSPGDEIVARGDIEHEKDGPLRSRRVVSHVRLVGMPEVCAVCPIQVCTKKNCWRSGGRELWAELERRLAAAGLAGTIELQAVECLDRCKHAPNLDWNGHEYSHCRPRDIEAIIAAVSATR